MNSTRAALEAALVAQPEDLALHAAYADFLIEEGDPRGEFIRLQLALEDPELPADRRAAMESAACQLILRHEREWLGPLRPFIAGGYGAAGVYVVWRRGWANHVCVSKLSDRIHHAIETEPLARLTRELVIRSFKGSVAPRRRRNRAARNSDFARLALSPNVRHLCHLGLQDSGCGDTGVNDLIGSGLLSRLDTLDLSRCNITDDGASALAACPDVRRLKSLTLDGNLISPIGVQDLAEVGFRIGPQFWDQGRGDAYV